MKEPRRWFVVEALYEKEDGSTGYTASAPVSFSEASERHRELAEVGIRSRVVETRPPRKSAMTAKQRSKLQGELPLASPSEGAHDTKNARK